MSKLNAFTALQLLIPALASIYWSSSVPASHRPAANPTVADIPLYPLASTTPALQTYEPVHLSTTHAFYKYTASKIHASTTAPISPRKTFSVEVDSLDEVSISSSSTTIAAYPTGLDAKLSTNPVKFSTPAAELPSAREWKVMALAGTPIYIVILCATIKYLPDFVRGTNESALSLSSIFRLFVQNFLESPSVSAVLRLVLVNGQWIEEPGPSNPWLRVVYNITKDVVSVLDVIVECSSDSELYQYDSVLCIISIVCVVGLLAAVRAVPYFWEDDGEVDTSFDESEGETLDTPRNKRRQFARIKPAIRNPGKRSPRRRSKIAKRHLVKVPAAQYNQDDDESDTEHVRVGGKPEEGTPPLERTPPPLYQARVPDTRNPSPSTPDVATPDTPATATIVATHGIYVPTTRSLSPHEHPLIHPSVHGLLCNELIGKRTKENNAVAGPSRLPSPPPLSSRFNDDTYDLSREWVPYGGDNEFILNVTEKAKEGPVVDEVQQGGFGMELRLGGGVFENELGEEAPCRPRSERLLRILKNIDERVARFRT